MECKCKLKIDGDVFQKLIVAARDLMEPSFSTLENAHERGHKAIHLYTIAIDEEDNCPHCLNTAQVGARWESHINSGDKRINACTFKCIMSLLARVWAGDEVKRSLTIGPCGDGQLEIVLSE